MHKPGEYAADVFEGGEGDLDEPLAIFGFTWDGKTVDITEFVEGDLSDAATAHLEHELVYAMKEEWGDFEFTTDGEDYYVQITE